MGDEHRRSSIRHQPPTRVRDVSWLTVDLKILKAVMERIANDGMKVEALYVSKLGFAKIIPTAEKKFGETN